MITTGAFNSVHPQAGDLLKISLTVFRGVWNLLDEETLISMPCLLCYWPVYCASRMLEFHGHLRSLICISRFLCFSVVLFGVW